MSTNVVDASVAAKWVLPASGEPLVHEAQELLRGHAAGRYQFMVPDLFWAELGNVFWKAVRQGRWTKSAGETAIVALKQLNFPTISSSTLLDLAFTIAISFDRTVYDCLYVALAVESNKPLITADERLANTLAAHFPVKWLGAI